MVLRDFIIVVDLVPQWIPLYAYHLCPSACVINSDSVVGFDFVSNHRKPCGSSTVNNQSRLRNTNSRLSQLAMYRSGIVAIDSKLEISHTHL
jgi:hypothetical protein